MKRIYNLSYYISGSKAHQIIHARTDHTRLSYFLEVKSLSHIESVSYGLQMEETARKRYMDISDHKVEKLGLFVCHQFPWIAVSPDGVFKIGDEISLLEIKCPYSCKDSSIENVPYLDKNGNLKKSHMYFTQIQLTAWVCNCKKAYLFVYTSKEQKIIEVNLDEHFV